MKLGKTARARMKEVEWLKQSAETKWISQGVVTIYPRKGKTFVGQTSKVLLAERADSRLYHRGEKS